MDLQEITHFDWKIGAYVSVENANKLLSENKRLREEITFLNSLHDEESECVAKLQIEINRLTKLNETHFMMMQQYAAELATYKGVKV